MPKVNEYVSQKVTGIKIVDGIKVDNHWTLKIKGLSWIIKKRQGNELFLYQFPIVAVTDYRKLSGLKRQGYCCVNQCSPEKQ